MSSSRATRRKALDVLFASVGFVALRFVLGPVRIKILTSLLSKDDYGRLNLISLTVAFLTSFLTLGSLEYLLRRLPGRAVEFQRGVFKKCLVVFGGGSVLFALVGIWAARFWRPLGLTTSDYLAWGLLFVLTVLINLYMHYFMGLTRYSLSRLAALLSTDTLFIPLLVFFWLGPLTISRVLWLWVAWLALTVAWLQRWERPGDVWRAAPPESALSEVLRFGLPLMPMILGEWIFALQDRYVLLYLMDLQAVAHYALAMGIASVGAMALGALMDVLLTEFLKIRNRLEAAESSRLVFSPELRDPLTLMTRYLLLFGLMGAILLATMGRPLVRILSTEAYVQAVPVLQWLALFPLLLQLGVVCGRILMCFGRGALVGASTLVAAVSAVALALRFVPVWGERGAALAVLLGYGGLSVFFAWRVRVWRWVNRAELLLPRLVFLILASGLVFVACNRVAEGKGALAGLILAGLWMAGAPVALKLVRREDLLALLRGGSAETA